MVQIERKEKLSEEPETVTFLAYSACRNWMPSKRIVPCSGKLMEEEFFTQVQPCHQQL